MEKKKKKGSEGAAAAAKRMINPWNRACIKRDWDALLAMCNDDIIFMPPGAPGVQGQAVRPWLDAIPPIKAMSWSVQRIVQIGNTAWLYGPVQQTFEIEGRDEHFDGKFCDVMRKGADGKWRISLVVWNSNQV